MKEIEETFRTWDGVKLFYRAWLPSKPARKALLLFHRGHEHSARWRETVEALKLEDFAVFAWDARGHGRSPGERGSAESLSAIVEDVQAFVWYVSWKHRLPLQNMIVLAHSVGAVSVTAWVLDHTPPIRGLILATPAFRVKLYVPFALPLLRLKQKLFGPGYVKSYVKSKVLTHDDEQASRYDADEFIFRQIAVNILLDLHDTSTRLLADAPAIRVPTLLLAAGSDWVVKLSAQQQFFRGLSSPVKQMQVYPGLFHALFHEKDRQLVINRVRDFILERFPEPSGDIAIDSAGQQTADYELPDELAVLSVLPAEGGTPNRSEFSLLDADKSGHTKAEYDRLSAPGGLRFAPVRLALKTVGRLSKGIQLGWWTGFDSGTTLDYVYENKAQGITPLGRWIDRAYLNSIGWRGIRQRRMHLERVLASVIETEHGEGERIHILDIAAGAG